MKASKPTWLNRPAQRLLFWKWAEIHTARNPYENRIVFCRFYFKIRIKLCQKTANKRGEKSYLKGIGRKIPKSQQAKETFFARNSLKLEFIWDYLENTTKSKSVFIAPPGSQGRFCCMKSFPLWKSMTGERSSGRGRLGRLPPSSFIISYVTRPI